MCLDTTLLRITAKSLTRLAEIIKTSVTTGQWWVSGSFRRGN